MYNTLPGCIINSAGDKLWHVNGKLHRTDGPAVEHTSGTNYWFLNGKLHRIDGPAVTLTNGTKEWHLNGKCYIKLIMTDPEICPKTPYLPVR